MISNKLVLNRGQIDTQNHTLRVHPYCCKQQDFLSLCGQIIFNFIYNNFTFLYSLSINIYLGYFHALTIVNNVAVNMGMLVFLQHSAFIYFGCKPRSRISGSYGSSIFNFLRIHHSFLQLLHQFTILQTVYKCSIFSTFSPEFVISCCVDDSCSKSHEVTYLTVVLICISLILSTFDRPVGHTYIFLV